MTGETAANQLAEALAELDEPKVLQLVDQILSESPESASQAITAIQSGMDQVGERFQSGEYFLAEMIFAAEVVKAVMPGLRDALKAGTQKTIGKILLGTVKGDIHDIGKNLVAVIMTAAGFDVVDLGIDVRPNSFVEAIKEHKPNIVGLSGLLTLSIDPMKETVEAINEAGLRDQVKVIIGGNPISAQIHEMVGADAWTNNAAEGVAICKKWVEVQ
jgi:methylmalonyl-CoA mutase cobalamin-binding domain/chain